MIKLSLMLNRPDKVTSKRVRRLRPVRPSRRNELWYKAELLKLVRAVTAEAERELLPFLKSKLGVSDSLVTDSKRSDIIAEIKKIASRFGGVLAVAERLAALAARRNLQAVDSTLIANIRAAVGVNITAALTGNSAIARAVRLATVANVDLITSIPTQYFEKLEKAIKQNFNAGIRYEVLAEKIKEVGSVTESRAKLIARDQTSKMASSFNKERQTQLGINKYIWQTSGDERVREDHAEHDGKTFRWDDPPANTGHPGEDIQCRCVAIPVFDLDEMERELANE
jgi:SPP1 gp7 family putative phage head morphogenesis protein